MHKVVSLALLVVGIILIVYGINASNSIGSDVSRTVTGSPTDKTIWLLAAGAAVSVIGLAGLFSGSRET